jgi:hypothetical protein
MNNAVMTRMTGRDSAASATPVRGSYPASQCGPGARAGSASESRDAGPGRRGHAEVSPGWTAGRGLRVSARVALRLRHGMVRRPPPAAPHSFVR